MTSLCRHLSAQEIVNWVKTAAGCVHTDDTKKLSPTIVANSCSHRRRRRDKTVSSRWRRRCVLGIIATVCDSKLPDLASLMPNVSNVCKSGDHRLRGCFNGIAALGQTEMRQSTLSDASCGIRYQLGSSSCCNMRCTAVVPGGRIHRARTDSTDAAKPG